MHKNIFVGRENELNILKSLLSDSQEGKGQVVFIQGEAGSGKSSLVKNFFLDYENSDKYSISESECTDKEGINAYLPFKEVLIKLNFDSKETKQNKKQKFEQLKNFVYQAGSSWVNLIPIIGNLASAGIETYKSYRDVYLKDSNIQIQNEAEIHQTFENLFRQKAQNKTLIIFLDDLQWCDNASLNFLFTLCRNIRKNPFKILLICTYRQNDLNVGKNKITETGQNIIVRHPLADKINELKNYTKQDIDFKENRKWFSELQINPFTIEEIAQFCQKNYEKNHFEQSFFSKIFALTQGHPLFVSEILRILEGKNIIFKDEKDIFKAKEIELNQLPTSISGVIAERIERLDKEQQKIISYASVEGNEISVPILENLLKIDELDLLDYLEELNKKHSLLLNTDPKRISDKLIEIYKFSNTLIHKYVYENIDSSRRRALHRKIAEIQKNLFGEALFLNEDLKKSYNMHIQIGQGLIDGITLKINENSSITKEKEITIMDNSVIDTISNLIKEAKQSFEQYAINECIDNLDKALAFLQNIENSEQSIDLTADALITKVDALNWQGLYQQANVYADKLMELVKKTTKQDLFAKAYAVKAKCLEYLGEYDNSIKNYENAIEINKNLNKSLYADNLNNLGFVLVRYGKYNQAIENFETAKNIFEQNNDQNQVAQSIMNIGYSYRSEGNYDKSIIFYETAQKFYEQSNNKRQIANCFNSIGLCYNWKGEYNKAINYFENALKIDFEINDIVNKANHYNNIGLAKESLGEYQQAIEYYQKALEIDESLNDKVKIPISYSNIGNCYLYLQEYEKSLEYHQKALAIYQQLNDNVNIAFSYQNIGEVYRMQNITDKAFDYFSKSLEINQSIGDAKTIASDYVNIANVYIQKSDFNKSVEYLLLALNYFEKIEDKMSIAIIYNNLASTYKSLQNFDKAFEYIEKSIEINKSVNDIIALKRNYINLAYIYEEQNDSEKAIEAYKQIANYALNLDYIQEAAEQYNKIGEIYEDLKKIDLALMYFQKAVDLFKIINDYDNIKNTYHSMFGIYEHLKQFNNAIKTQNEVVKIFTEAGNEDKLADTYLTIGNFYYNNQDDEKAEQYYFKSLQLYIKDENEYGEADCYYNLGLVNKYKPDYETAIDFFEKSRQILLSFEEDTTSVEEQIEEIKSKIGGNKFNKGSKPDRPT